MQNIDEIQSLNIIFNKILITINKTTIIQVNLNNTSNDNSQNLWNQIWSSRNDFAIVVSSISSLFVIMAALKMTTILKNDLFSSHLYSPS